MEYERIHKVQVGVLSPTKLRMKFLGAHNCMRKAGNNSSCASPPKNNIEHAQNRLVLGNVQDEVSDTSTGSKTSAIKDVSNSEAQRADESTVQNITRTCSQQPPNSNSSMIHPVRSQEEESSNDYDSGHDNASTSSFEFQGTERSSQNPMAGQFYRQSSSKWTNAEKWIMNRAMMNQNVPKKPVTQNLNNRQANSTAARGFLESSTSNRNTNPNWSASRSILEKFSFVTHHPNLVGSVDVCAVNSNSASMESVARQPSHDQKVDCSVQSLSMRDIGTEMTPIPSQEPSRTATPLGSITPTRSPNSSIPSTPVGERRAENNADENPYFKRKGSRNELSEQELRLETRKEIAALGVQLGKVNIATWASKNDLGLTSPSTKTSDLDHVKKDYAARASAWEEAENFKHTARLRREELEIQAWESHQRAKIEAELKKIEENAERMRIEAMERMAEKLELTRRLAEEKRATAKVRMNEQATRAVRKAEQIRRNGRVPSSYRLCCNGCFPEN